MGVLNTPAEWIANIYQLEESDPVQAGPGGIDNRQAEELGKRTSYLKQKIEENQAATVLVIDALDDKVDTNKTLTDAAILALRGVGRVDFFPGSTAPDGYIKANGATLSRAAYPELWAFAQSRIAPANDTLNYPGLFGSGDGATTFKVPDLRDYFPRFQSDGAATEYNREPGSKQEDDIKSHDHPYQDVVYTEASTAGGTDANGRDGKKIIGAGIGGSNSDYDNNYGFYENSTTGPTGGVETRPKNIALLGCIKY